jgi:predicted AlkP superfamily pyrophosphatase or phosphodiesterase
VLKQHAPNLLLIHLVEVDHVQHKFGPRTPEAYWSVSYADDRLRDLVEAVNASPRRDQTTIVVVSDHGFFPIEKEIRPNVLLRKAGLISKEKKQAYCLNQGGAAMVYILDGERRAELSARLQTELAAIEGVEAVLAPEAFAKLGQPNPAEDSRAPDLWLTAKSGYSFGNAETGEDVVTARESKGGTHGYLPDQPDMQGTLVISGAGIRAGTQLGKVSTLDVAPTMARLLGVELPTAEGRVLTKALRED